MDSLETRLHDAKLASAIDNACTKLPTGFSINIRLEEGSAVVELLDGEFELTGFPSNHESLSESVVDAVTFAIHLSGDGEKSTGSTDIPMFLLQNCSAGYLGNSPLFWAKDDNGYTQWIDEAKIWTLEEARNQICSTQGTHSWEMWPLSLIESQARRTIDIQDLRKQPIGDSDEMRAAFTHSRGESPLRDDV